MYVLLSDDRLIDFVPMCLYPAIIVTYTDYLIFIDSLSSSSVSK